MGELLCNRGAIPSSLPSSFSPLRCLALFRGPPVGVSARHDQSGPRSNRSCLGTSVSWNVRHPERRSRRGYGDLLKCERSIHQRNCLPLRDGVGSRVSFFSKVCRKPPKERIVVASLRSALVCDCCEGYMDNLLVTGDRFGSSSLLTGQQKIKIASVYSDVVLARSLPGTPRVARGPRYYSRSRIQSAVNNKFHTEYSLGPDIQPLIESPHPGRADFPKRIKLRDIYRSHIAKRKVTVQSKPKPWWKQVLFQQLNEEDFDYDPEGDEEIGESDSEDDEFEEEIPFGSENPEDLEDDEIDKMLADDRRFYSWQQKRTAIDELREYQETGRDPDSRDWEDWLDDSWGDYSQYLGDRDGGWYTAQSEWEKGGVPREPPKIPERGMSRTFKELLFRIFETQEEVEDDLDFEEKVFRFTSRSTAKFVTILILVPWAIDFIVHDFAVVPFLRRWVEEVPLAAKLLDVKESQKLYMIERLKVERQRVRFEAEIGKAPPLSDEELNEHIREEALELREELREENRHNFANIWSDAVAGFTLFLLLVFNPQQVSIMQMTGDRLFTNISDTGKAFIIILCTDIFLGYHSESGWETVIEILLDHYGFEVSQGSIYIFVAIVPVTIDACFKLWVFRYLSRLSPSAAATFREMKRH